MTLCSNINKALALSYPLPVLIQNNLFKSDEEFWVGFVVVYVNCMFSGSFDLLRRYTTSTLYTFSYAPFVKIYAHVTSITITITI